MSDDEDSDLADLFEGFDSRYVETGEAKLFCRIGGDGPPLLLLHGYPQCHVMWHKVAPALAERFTLVIPDLRGYGWSFVPRDEADHAQMSKRAMARDMVRLMEEIGHARFALAGHDRGGRVAYRLALDHPGRLTKLAVLDIVPTHTMWSELTSKLAMKTYHWMFLAQPEPLPETLIGPAARFYLETTIASWTKAKSIEAFDERAMEHYARAFVTPERLHAMCEDYRSGATCDFEHDMADVAAGNTIACPLLAIWGATGIPARSGDDVDSDPLSVWRRWADDVTGGPLDSGHFLAEEAPQETATALLDFLGR